MESSDICNRCLSIPNVSMVFGVRFIVFPETTDYQPYYPATIPEGLAQWASEILALDPQAKFTCGAMYSVIIPFSTWHGDKVCLSHLMDLAGEERSWWGRRDPRLR